MDEETDQITSGSVRRSLRTKSEPLNNQVDLSMEDIKLKQEESSGDNVYQGSTMTLDNDSDCGKSNTSMKRSSKTPALLISKLPKHFSYELIKDHLEKLCGPCEIKVLKDNDDGRVIKAVFKNVQKMTEAKMILASESIDGAPITVTEYQDTDCGMENDGGPPVKRKKDDDEEPWGLDMDVWRTDPKGYYGVKPEYLNTLGINDSLRNWVLVLNFRCGKDELKEVMELAGTVLVCSVHNRRSSHNANVMYSHPLEALQAISMLNGQMLYGRPLTVKILKSNGAVLPKGLANVGPGLAKYGKPLRDIVRHYERYVKGQSNGLNMNLFRTPEEQALQEAEIVAEDENSKKRAKSAIENLVAEGVDIKDLVLALKEIIAEQKNEAMEKLLADLDNESDDGSEVFTNNKIDASKTEESNSDRLNKSTSASPDLEKISSSGNIRKSKTLPGNCGSVGSLPSSDSGSISTFPGSNNQSIRSTPSPSSLTSQRRPGNPIKPIGTPNSQDSSFGSSRNIGTIPTRSAQVPTNPSYHRQSNPCSQMFAPNAPRNPMPGLVRPMNSGPMFGPSGSMPSLNRSTLGPTPGPITSPISRPGFGSMAGPRSSLMSGPMSGPMSGSMSGPMQGQMSGPMPGPNGPMSGPGRPMSGLGGPMTGPTAGPNFSMPGPNTHPPFGPTVHPTSSPEATLQFSNLPPSTTFSLLSDKLAQVGQLVSIQFTVPGCVVAKYAHRSHAESCLKLFDKTCLDGNVIDVRFV